MGFHPFGFLRVQDGAALGRALIQLHLGYSRAALLGWDVGHGGVVLLRLLAQLRQLLELGGGNVPLEWGDGGADAVHPLLLVEDVVGLQRVGLAQAGILETDSENVFGFIRISKSSSEGASHFDISILEVFEEQLLDRDGLAVHLECLALVPAHRPCQHQDVLEEEDVELMSIFILQLPVAQQSFAAFNPWILLLLIQVFQLVNVILALGLALLQVDIREDSLDYGYLKTQTNDSE